MNDNDRLKYLDSIRGIAALMVAAFHFLEKTPIYHHLIFKYVNFGQIGVVMFFIVSGMVIPYSFKDSKRPIVNFTLSRFFRLYSAYWVSIMLAIISLLVIKKEAIDIKVIICNVTMFQSLLGAPDLFGVYWTLIIEMFFT